MFPSLYAPFIGDLDFGLSQRADTRQGRLGEYAYGFDSFGTCFCSRLCRHMGRFNKVSRRSWTMKYSRLLLRLVLAVFLGACGSTDRVISHYGPNRDLREPRRECLPDVTVAGPAPWGDRLQ